MIRFVLKRHQRDINTGVDWTTYETIDGDVVPLESALTRGGRGENGYDLTERLGVEVFVATKDPRP